MIIGIHGFKGSGKDTVATYIARQYGFTQIAFADKVKESICGMFDITLEQIEEWKNNDEYHVSITGPERAYDFKSRVTFRQFIQRFATEGVREVFGYDFWIQFVIDTYKGSFPQNFVVSDARFENELKAILGEGGKNLHVIRPSATSDGHASEIAFDELCDGRILNYGSFDDLFAAVDVKMMALGFRR